MTDARWAGWLEANGIGGPVDYHAHGGLLARRQAEQAERDAEQAEARRLAGLEEARDQRLTAMYLAGVQPGATVQRAMAMADLEAEMGGLRDQMVKLQRRYDRLRQEGKDEAETAATASRMAEGPAPRTGVEGALQRARGVVREVRAEARAEARVASRSVNRPKGAGAAVRAEGDVTCQDCLNMGATEAEAFAIHHPELLPAMGEEPATVPDDTERWAGGYGREITRLTLNGRMGQVGTLYGGAVR
jgi:hypothetical protein